MGVARPGTGREPWYLLISDRSELAEAAWRGVFAAARRWQSQLAWRYGTSEVALERPRVWSWERWHRWLLMVTLASAFLLSVLAPALLALHAYRLRHWRQRTGTRSRTTPTPLSRLRTPLSRRWLAHLNTHEPPQNSG